MSSSTPGIAVASWIALALVGCAGGPRAPSANTLPEPHLVTASASRSLWIGGGSSSSSSRPATPPAPAARRHAVWVSTSACAFPVTSADPTSEKVPSFDPRRCAAIVERVLVDGENAGERVLKVEQLTIEDVAVKLEALLGRDVGGDDE